MKVRYQRYCQSTKGGYYQDPFLKADVEEFSREREMQQRIMLEQLATASPLTAATAAAVGSTALSAAPPASNAGLFGQLAPAPAMGGLFGSPGEFHYFCRIIFCEENISLIHYSFILQHLLLVRQEGCLGLLVSN
jgi:hypothetical protein